MSPPPLLTRVLCDLGPSTAQLEVLSALAIQLSEIPGIAAVVLGGSYARGTARADSDLDVGVYYSEQALPDVDSVRRCAELLSAPSQPPTVTGFYAWGPWVNGGAWIRTPAGKVDLLYSNTNQVRRVLHSKLATRFPPGNRERWVRLNSCGDLYTGQRLADIAALTWDNLDLSKNEIRLRTRKTAKRIMVPIAKPLRQHIDSLPAGDQPGTPIHPEAFTIISRHGRSANLSNHFADLLAQAGLRERARPIIGAKERVGIVKEHRTV
jgi:predicted nucleotidyltransferase